MLDVGNLSNGLHADETDFQTCRQKAALSSPDLLRSRDDEEDPDEQVNPAGLT